MLYIKIILALLFELQNCLADVVHAVPRPHLPAAPPGAPHCNGSAAAQKNSYGLHFHLPFMDIRIENEHNLHVMKEPHTQHLFALHGNELYQMFVSREEKRLSWIGLLAGSVSGSEPLGAAVISWHNYLIIVIALDEQLEIYQISEAIIEQRAEISKDPKRSNETFPHFETIQQLTLSGRYQKLYLINSQEDKVMLIAAVNFTKMYGKIRTFEWLNTYFDPIEDITVPPIHVFQVVGVQPKYLISGRTIRHQSKTILTVYEVKLPAMNLRAVQTLTVASRTVQASTFRGRNYLIACTRQQKHCNSFRMSEGQFNVHKQRSGKELAFDKFVAGTHFLVGSYGNEIKVYTNARLDCYGTFTSNESEVSTIMTVVNAHDEDFILLIYKRTFHTLVRVVEVETESGEVLSTVAVNATDAEDITVLRRQQHLFEDSIGKLRSILLQRKTAMDVFRRVADFGDILKPTMLKMKHPVRIHAGNIGIIRIEGKTLRSPMQLLNRIENMGRRYRRTRLVRSPQAPSNLSVNVPLRLKVQCLSVQNLIYDKNLLEGFDLDNLTQPLPILSIRPQLTTKILQTPQLLTRQNHKTPRQVVHATARDNSTTKIKTQQLFVQRINDIPWSEFYDSLFLRNRDTKIQGRLILQADTKISNLQTPLLNGLVVQQLFNLKHPQVVNANIVLAGFFVSDLRAEFVNGLNFAEDIVFSGEDSFIETPVTFHQLSIARDFVMTNNFKNKRFAQARANPDFDQYYTGRVILNGSLTVNNLMRESDINSHIFVKNIPFTVSNLKETYMLKNEPQIFNTTIVFGNTKVTAPSLHTDFLNDHPTEQHLLKSESKSTIKKPLFLVVMSAHVAGNLTCTDYNSKILELHQNAVRHGEVANITGIKVFEAPLTVNDVMTLELNRLPVSELVLRSQLKNSYKFKDAKSFENIYVDDKAYVEQHLNSSYLNSLPLEELLNYDYHLDSLYLPHRLNVTNIVFHKINGISFDDVFTKFRIRDQQLVLHKDLIIEGDVVFGENLEVENVNGIAWNSYQESLVRFNENAEIGGQKRFLSELVVTQNLQTPMLNNMNMQEIFSNVLSKSKPQLITGSYTFDNVSFTNLDALVINDMATAAFIDTRVSALVIEGDVIAPKLTVHGDIKGHFANQFNFSNLPDRLLDLPRRPWRNLVVLGNAKWNITDAIDKSQHDRLEYLNKNAVRRLGNQVITGNVKLKRPLITKMITKTAFPKDIDFDVIARDCLIKNTTLNQLVYGAKTFLKPLHMENIEAASALKVPLLNKIDVLRFNASLYRLTSGAPIIGPLHFKTPPTVGHLAVQCRINGIKSEQIYHLPQTPLPTLKIRNLNIENTLEIQDVNDMSLNYLLENRVTKDGDALEIFGFLTFENLVLNKEILLQSINGIPLEYLIFKKSTNLQAIADVKSIDGDLTLQGPAHILSLNGRDLSESYQRTVFTNRNYHFDSLVVDAASFEAGLVLENNIVALDNNASPTFISEQANTNLKQRAHFNAITRQLQELDNIIDSSIISENQHLLYLEYDFKTEILWQTPDESIVKSHFYEVKRISNCERQLLHVQKSKLTKRFYLHNITTNFITANAYDLNVKAENYCKTRYRKVKSKITITGSRNLSKVFGMKKYIENVEIYSPDKTVVFVILHVIDLTTNRNEVRILKIDNETNDVSDWQSITLGVGKLMRLYQFDNYTALISAALINNHPALSIYNYVTETQQFKLAQIIDGDFDIVEMVVSTSTAQPRKYQLIASCRHCQRIQIYELNADQTESSYQIFQIIKLKIIIDKLLVFSLNDGSLYLLVLSEMEHGCYHLYKYSHIQGWLHSNYGYFHNIQMALPLTGNSLKTTGDDDDNLLLLCASEKCSLVKTFVMH